MAIRFDASGDYLSRTTSLPSPTAYTYMGWHYLVSDRNTAGGFFTLRASTTSEILARVGDNGTVFEIGTQAAYYASTIDLVVGTWYHVAVTNAGTAAGDLLGYLNGVQVASGTGVSFTATAFEVGRTKDLEWADQRVAGVKVLNRAATQATILDEMWYGYARSLDRVNCITPLNVHGDLYDRGGQSRNWTANGTLTTEDGPPGINYFPRRRRVWAPMLSLDANAGGGAATVGGPVLQGRAISPGRIFGGSALTC